MKRPARPRPPATLQGTLRGSFLRVSLVTVTVLFMLLSVPPLMGRMLQGPLHEHLKVVARDAQPVLKLLRSLGEAEQITLLEGLNTGQVQLLRKDSPVNAGQIYVGAFQVDVFTQNDQVTLIQDGKVVWSQGFQPGPVPAHWVPHLGARKEVVLQNEDMGPLMPLLRGVPVWVARSMQASTWMVPLGEGQVLAVTAFQPRTEVMGAVLVLLYVVMLLSWAFLVVLPAGLGSLVVSSIYARREARTLSRPIEALSHTAQLMASGNLQAKAEPAGPRELQDLARTINTISENLSSSMRQLQGALDNQKSFLQSISHDLRTPLSHILAFSEDLTVRLSGGPFEKKAHIIHREALALGRMVDDLFDLLRFEHPEFRLERKEVDLQEVVLRGVQAFSPRAEEKGILLTSQTKQDLVVLADEMRLQQVLGNLLSNALQHTPSGGKITVQVDGQGEWTSVSVTDTGSGIPPEHLPHIFERFYRAESSRTDRHAGLGLTICRELLQRMNGQISVQSVEGQGSTFTVTLPVAHSDEPRV